jgi:hypothetical protein
MGNNARNSYVSRQRLGSVGNCLLVNKGAARQHGRILHGGTILPVYIVKISIEHYIKKNCLHD